ncbi:MAG: hypothetical protein HY321_22515 [Armatimonadetes bacterium]|nr:hypothetical protein [Armatimonadota bacterium]
MATPSGASGTPCPWCHEGRIVIHDPKEDWWVTEEGDAASESYSGKFPAGIRRKRFKTPPVEWFSCTSCAMTGTIGYLETIIARTTNRRRPDMRRGSAHAVKRGTLAGALP